MTTETATRTKHLIPFAYIVTIIVPLAAPMFSAALFRENENAHAVAVAVLAVVWAAVLFLVIL